MSAHHVTPAKAGAQYHMNDKMLIRRAGERGHADHGWLRSWHTFSFADYHDPEWMGFKSLRVINEDFIAPGKGFDLHGHRDMEILTYVMSGALRHVDTMGNNEIIRAGEFQRMTAGTGVQHMEVSATQTEETHLYQIWILPNKTGLIPSYEKYVVPRERVQARPVGTQNALLIASPDGRSGSLTIHQDAEVWLYRLEAGETATIEVPAGKAGWVQLVSGEVEIGREGLKTSDAAVFEVSTEVTSKVRANLMIFLV